MVLATDDSYEKFPALKIGELTLISDQKRRCLEIGRFMESAYDSMKPLLGTHLGNRLHDHITDCLEYALGRQTHLAGLSKETQLLLDTVANMAVPLFGDFSERDKE